MTSDEALEIARKVAQEKGWPWLEPVSAVRRRTWLIGPVYWNVTTNLDKTGMNVTVTIADASRKVVNAGFAAR